MRKFITVLITSLLLVTMTSGCCMFCGRGGGYHGGYGHYYGAYGGGYYHR